MLVEVQPDEGGDEGNGGKDPQEDDRQTHPDHETLPVRLQRAQRGDAVVGDDDGVVVVPSSVVDEVIRIAHEREEVEEVIKAQLEIEQCSPGKYYPFNDLTWQLFEEKTGKKRTG